MSIVVSHPTGNANLRAVLRAMTVAGLLERFHTTLALPASRLNQMFGPAFDRRLGQRCFPEVSWSQIRLHPGRELVRQAAGRIGLSAPVRHETGWASVDAVYTSLDQAVANDLRREAAGVQAVYAYEDGALQSFRVAAELGMTRLYDLPSIYWKARRRLFKEEAERLPEWAQTLDAITDSVEKNSKKDEEISEADHVLVASTFNQKCLTDHFGGRLSVSILPYGCPEILVDHPSQRPSCSPLKLFFAGRLTQQKGVADLISALDRLSIEWQITVAGQRPQFSPIGLDRFLNDPRCSWIGTVPHQTLLDHMSKAHVFVFPSLSEGFGMVITEAMAAGLPVITTPHTAGPDILTEGKNGFIVPIRDPDAIADRITRLAQDEPLRVSMATHALQTAASLGWSAYEAGIIRIVNEQIAA